MLYLLSNDNPQQQGCVCRGMRTNSCMQGYIPEEEISQGLIMGPCARSVCRLPTSPGSHSPPQHWNVTGVPGMRDLVRSQKQKAPKQVACPVEGTPFMTTASSTTSLLSSQQPRLEATKISPFSKSSLVLCEAPAF